MVPHELKVAWVSLSLSGLIGCWMVFLSWGRVAGFYWGPVVYCIGCTLVQILFCLGLIWQMEPSSMPQKFCIVQPILMGFGTFLMSGMVTALAIATTIAAMKPKTWTGGGKGALVWRCYYLCPMLMYPMLASVVHLAIALRYDTRHHFDGLFCDYSEPIWLRFLSYAGVPLLLYILPLCLSIYSLLRISKTNGHLKRSRDPGMDIDHLAELPRRPGRVHFRRPRPLCLPPPIIHASRMEALSSSPTLASSRFSLARSKTSRSTSLRLDTLHEAHRHPDLKSETHGSMPSPASSFSIPRFNNPGPHDTVMINADNLASTRSGDSQDAAKRSSVVNDDWREILGPAGTDGICYDEPKWSGNESNTNLGSIEYEAFKEVGQDSVDSYFGGNHRRSFSRTFGGFKSRRPLPSLPPSVCRSIVFQFAYLLVPLLGFLSPFIDAVKDRHPPSSFGTQHVSLLLSAWIPVFVFGLLPAVRRALSFSEARSYI